MFDIASVRLFLESPDYSSRFQYDLEDYVCAQWGTDEDYTPGDFMHQLPRPLTLQQSMVTEALRIFDGWENAGENASLDAAESGAGMERFRDYQAWAAFGDQ